MSLNQNIAPAGFIAKERGENFCYECAFHTGKGHDFIDCTKKSGNQCMPSRRDDKSFVVFVKRPN